MLAMDDLLSYAYVLSYTLIVNGIHVSLRACLHSLYYIHCCALQCIMQMEAAIVKVCDRVGGYAQLGRSV
jgi:hypothetical protein